MQTLTQEQYKAKYGDNGAWKPQVSSTLGRQSITEALAAPIVGGVKNVGKIAGGVVNEFKQSGQNILENINKTSTSLDYNPQEKQNVGTTVLNTAGQVAKTAFAPFTEILKTVGSDISQNAPQGAKDVASKVSNYVSSEVQPLVQKYNEFAAKNPELAKDFENAINVAMLLGGKKVEPSAVGGAEKVLNTAAENAKAGFSAVKTGVNDIVDSSLSATKNSLDTVAEQAAKLKENTQLLIAKKNVNPQLAESTKRLFLDGTKRLEYPVATYDKYLAQSKQALTDIKAEPAISQVGNDMGNAFEQVIKQRSEVGKVLGDELKANGKVKINITQPKTSLLSELKDSGLSYNPKSNRLTSFQGSKFAPEEVKMLDNFVQGVNALGDSPTIKQIDNFISKTRSTLAFTKGESGVMGTTNAERIINGGIAKLKESLNPGVNGNKALAKYWEANKTYSDLSDFIDEGSTFLGKKTLAGDFAKDASVAKSSVQSILNQGKKDFMVKLEALTGYKAIDNAVLALQAMKDAGDFRGLSLLQAMSESGVPTSKAGFTQKIIDLAVKKGGEMVAGTPEEQTRAFIKSLSNK